jgi:hypothetical protein
LSPTDGKIEIEVDRGNLEARARVPADGEMVRNIGFAIILLAGSGLAQGARDLSGTWTFTHDSDQFRGWIVLHQSGDILRGTWHTSRGKSEPDTEVTGRVDGASVTLWRFIGDSRQIYSLTRSADGDRLDGFGDGFFLNHTNLDMVRSRPPAASKTAAAQPVARKQPDAAPADISGRWIFTHDHDRFRGTILLSQQGSEITGTWHTGMGKTEPDTQVFGKIQGSTVTLWRFFDDAQQVFQLTLSPDRSRLDGFGDGFFLNHTNLNLLRTAGPSGR